MSTPEEQLTEPTAPESPDAGAAEPPVTPEDEVTKLRRELDELRDKNLRLIAESQNAQKRAQRERQEALRYAEFDFAREWLVVLDDLERTQASAQTATDVQAVADGVRIVYEHCLKVLSQHNITPIDALHKPFDPTYHEAMMQQPCEDHPAGTVIQELARGYTMHERVLRSTRVIVSAGPATAPAGGAESGKE